MTLLLISFIFEILFIENDIYKKKNVFKYILTIYHIIKNKFLEEVGIKKRFEMFTSDF